MRIAGEWQMRDDGVTRPILRVKVFGVHGHQTTDNFLMRGEFAGFTDPTATDLSILGRDVLDHFDVLISRRRNEIWLLAPRHGYRIESS
jgi:hypothetical protein